MAILAAATARPGIWYGWTEVWAVVGDPGAVGVFVRFGRTRNWVAVGGDG